MHEVFRFHPASVNYIEAKYAQHLYGNLSSVSVHTRFGGSSEPQPSSLGHRRVPGIAWYYNVIVREFDVRSSVFLLFAENVDKLQELINKVKESHPDFKYVVVDEDSGSSLLLMSLCKHHVVTVSTFGMWGAYLDKHQPYGGKTVVHSRYESLPWAHGPGSIPFAEWKRIGDEYDKIGRK